MIRYSVHAASTKHNSLTVVTKVWWRSSLSIFIEQTCIIYEKFGELAGQDNRRTFCVSRKVRMLSVTYSTLSCWNEVFRRAWIKDRDMGFDRNIMGTVQSAYKASKRWQRSVSTIPSNTAVTIMMLLVESRFAWKLDERPVSRFVVDYSIEGVLVCDVASRITKAMVAKQTVHKFANILELFVHTLVVLQTTPLLDSKLVTSFYDPLLSCG